MDPSAARAAPQPACPILNLPDDLLGRVLALAGRSERESVTLVCKRFYRVFYSEPELWRRLHIGPWLLDPSRVDKYQGFLEKRLIPMLWLLHELSMGSLPDQLAASYIRFAAYWHPSRLHSLQLGRLEPSDSGSTPMVFEAMTRLTALTRLAVHCPEELPPAAVAALHSLTGMRSLAVSTDRGQSGDQLAPVLRRFAAQLTHLELRSQAVPPAVVAAIGSLRQLRRLRLQPVLTSDVANVLTQLASLEALWLSCRMLPDGEQLPPVSIWAHALASGHLPPLRMLQLHTPDALSPALLHNLTCHATQLTALEIKAGLGDVRQLSCLTRLRCLSLRSVDYSSVPQLPLPSVFPNLVAYVFDMDDMSTVYQMDVSGQRMRHCAYTPCGCTLQEFELDGLASLLGSWLDTEGRLVVDQRHIPASSLDQLLEPLLPPGAQLCKLSLWGTAPSHAAIQSSSHIAPLNLLDIPLSSPGLLKALPSALPHLTSLRLTGQAPITGLQPDQLPSMPALRELRLGRWFDTSGGSAIDAYMPALLAGAPQLTLLDLTGDMSSETYAALCSNPANTRPSWSLTHPIQPLLAAPAWLAGLRGIRSLSLHCNFLADLPAGPYLESLTDLNLEYNTFERLPPSLTAATGLTSLALTFNYVLAIETEDVDQILARMRYLLKLNLRQCPQSLTPDAHQRLAEQLPDLDMFLPYEVISQLPDPCPRLTKLRAQVAKLGI